MPWGQPVDQNPFEDEEERLKGTLPPKPPAFDLFGSFGAVGNEPQAPVPAPAPYDPMQAFAPNSVLGPQPKDPGILGQSFGMLSPAEQQADLSSRFDSLNAQQGHVRQLEKLIAQTKNPYQLRALKTQLQNATMPDIDQLHRMEAGDLPLASKTALRAGVENAATGFAETVLGVPEFVGIMKGYLNAGVPGQDFGPKAPGLLQQGNIDLNARPVVRNPDGSISTVRSMSANFDGKEFLIPTVSDDGRVLSDDQAVELFRRTGKHLGVFDRPENATAYAEQLHNNQAQQYGKKQPSVDDDTLLKWSLGAKDYVKGLFPGDAARQNDFGQQFASGLGQIAAFYGSGALAALAKAGPRATAAVVASLGSTATGSSGFEEGTRELQAARAKAAASGDTASVTEFDRMLKTMGYSAIGLTEAIPVARTFSRAVPNPVTSIENRLVQTAEGALEEALQESGSQLAQNLTTQRTTDPNRQTSEGVADSGAVGGALGGFMNFLMPGKFRGPASDTAPSTDDPAMGFKRFGAARGEPLTPAPGGGVVTSTPPFEDRGTLRAIEVPEETRDLYGTTQDRVNLQRQGRGSAAPLLLQAPPPGSVSTLEIRASALGGPPAERRDDLFDFSAAGPRADLVRDNGAELAYFKSADPNEIYVGMVSTLPSMRRQGRARALMNKLIAHADADNKTIRIMAGDEDGIGHDNLVKFYRSFGFREVGEIIPGVGRFAPQHIEMVRPAPNPIASATEPTLDHLTRLYWGNADFNEAPPEIQGLVRGYAERLKKRGGLRPVASALGEREVAPKEVDALGYYSKALEEAKALPQAKGTPEQMLAQLEKAGVKNNEIVATGLDSLLLGPELAQERRRLGELRNEISTVKTQLADPKQSFTPEVRLAMQVAVRDKGAELATAEKALAQQLRGAPKSISRDAIIQHLTQNRTRLQESRYGAGDLGGRIADVLEKEAARGWRPEALISRESKGRREHLRYMANKFRNGEYVPTAALNFTDTKDLIPDDLANEIDARKPAKWAQYSLDPKNPTYRETVLHLPGTRKALPFNEWVARHGDRFRQDERREAYEQYVRDTPQQAGPQDWKSGHWAEPNIIAHMRTGEYSDAQGRKVLLLDELQSDEGQQIREKGVATPERAQARKERIDRLQAEIDQMVAEGASPLAKAYKIAQDYDAENETDYAQSALSSGRMASGAIVHSDYYGFEKDVRAQVLEPDPAYQRLKAESGRRRRHWESVIAHGHERGSPQYQEAYEAASRAERDVEHYWEQMMQHDPARLKLAELDQLRTTSDTGRKGHPLINTTDQWVETAMRRLITQAVESGADAIAITPGTVQAKRFSLGSVIDSAYVDTQMDNGRRNIVFNAPGGMSVVGSLVVDPDGTVFNVGGRMPQEAKGQHLRATVGDGAAQRLMAAGHNERVSVEEMEVGGSGMRATYDKIYPRALGRLLQKLDKSIKPEKTSLRNPATGGAYGTGGDPNLPMAAHEFTVFPITEKAKQALAADAQPLYAVRETGEPRGRHQQAGDRGGRTPSGSLAPLKGAPAVEGATGPDPRVVAAAEDYARTIGIDLKRQAEFAKIDEALAGRIAAAYEAMPHTPQDPAVRAAYDDMVAQTIAQYRALEKAGYRFWLYDEATDPYQGNPWNSIRDLRQNQRMAVFATEAGFGSDPSFQVSVEESPMLADSGIRWPYGSANGPLKRVLVNDLFRAVHDIFGHSIEGAGFRARGEENAWQAHIRLYYGPAVGAVTTETRGQNSWLNFGPYGEANRNASVEDTVFADQKLGLMPSWTWEEGRVGDEVSDGDILGTLNVGAEALAGWKATLADFFEGQEWPGPAAATEAVATMVATGSRSPSAMQKALSAEGFGPVSRPIIDQGLLVTNLLSTGRDVDPLASALKGFYSPAIHAARKIKQEKATPEQWWQMISKTPGVRAEELAWMGLKQWLDEKGELMKVRPGSNLPPSMTTLAREEIIEFMEAHQFELKEQVLRSEPPPEWAAEAQRIADEETARRMEMWQANREGRLAELQREPEPEPEAEEDDEAEDPYEGMVSDYDRTEAIDEAAREIFEELENQAVDENMREWEGRHHPRHFDIQTNNNLDDADRATLSEAEAELEAALEERRAGRYEQLTLPGIAAPRMPILADFLPEGWNDDEDREKPFSFYIDKPSGNEDGDYDSADHDEFFATEAEAQAAAEAWISEAEDEYEDKYDRERESQYDSDFAYEWGRATEQATEAWDNENPDWVPEEDRVDTAERREATRRREAADRERAIRDVNTPPPPVAPKRWADQSKFAGYKIGGGEQYTELLVRMPELSEKKGYDSPHFHSDEVVHVRFDTRQADDGSNVLLIHEIQSDLHQRARGFGFGEVGYARAAKIIEEDGFTPETLAEFIRLRDLEEELYRQVAAFRNMDASTRDFGTIPPENEAAYQAKLQEASEVGLQKNQIRDAANKLRHKAHTYQSTFGRKGAPEAPYTGDAWWQLAFKAALQHAVEHNFGAIAMTTPQQISAASYTPASVAQKFYGENLPRYIDKYVKQWGSKRQEQSLSGVGDHSSAERARDGLSVPLVLDYYQQLLDDPGRGLTSNELQHLERFVQKLRQLSPQEPRSQQFWTDLLSNEDNPTVSYYARNGYWASAQRGDGFQGPLFDRRIRQAVWPITDKMRQDITEVGQPLAATSVPAQVKAAIYGMIKLDRAVPLPAAVPDSALTAVEPFAMALPKGHFHGALTRIEPLANQPHRVLAVFKLADGSEIPMETSLAEVFASRALYVSEGDTGRRGVLFNRFTPASQFDQTLRGELRHEAVHALRDAGLLTGREWAALLSHARHLRVLDLQIGEYLGAIGYAATEETPLIEIYQNHYASRTEERRNELLDQESVAHMVELYSHGAIPLNNNPEVKRIVQGIFRGDYSDGPPRPRGSADATALRPLNTSGELVRDDPNFKRWFKDSKVVDADGHPLILYHGTLADIRAFDPQRKGRTANVGSGFYFSSSTEDTSNNYASSRGPDIRNRLEKYMEELELDGVDPDEIEERAFEAFGYAHDGMNIPVYLKMEKPVILKRHAEGGGTKLDYELDYDEEAGDYTGNESGAFVDFVKALRFNAAMHDGIEDAIEGIIADLAMTAMDDGAISAKLIYEQPWEDRAADVVNGEGEMIYAELVRQSFEDIGYDGIIDESVDEKFRRMPGVGGATHYIVFHPNQIKSVFNRGTFDPENTDIAYAFAGDAAQGGSPEMKAKAIELEAQGVEWDAIFEQTGYIRGNEGRWRWEVDDSASAIKVSDQDIDEWLAIEAESPGQALYLHEFLDHPELYKAYPFLKDIDVAFDLGEPLGSAGFGAIKRSLMEKMRGKKRSIGKITLGMADYEGGDNDRRIIRRSLMHEIQHAIQRHEGHAYGSSPEGETIGLWGRLVHDALTAQDLKVLKRKEFAAGYAAWRRAKSRPGGGYEAAEWAEALASQAGDPLYRRQSGEIEAELAADRMALIPEHRQRWAPDLTGGYGDEEIGIRFDDDADLPARTVPPAQLYTAYLRQAQARREKPMSFKEFREANQLESV